MASGFDITNARVPGGQGRQRISVGADGAIAAIAPMAQAPASAPTQPQYDVAGDWISRGGVDLQINGALGLAFPELTPANRDRLAQVGAFLWQQGIDAYAPTLITSAPERVQQALAAIAQYRAAQPAREARILGAHLEGPFLNPDKRGAHPAQWLQPLTAQRVRQLLGDRGDAVRIVTLAPELDPDGHAIAELRARGTTVSLGHSLAAEPQARAAFGQGASMVTHAFNAMPGLHHREPGLLGATLTASGVRCGTIADGVHVCPTMLQLLLCAAQGERGAFLVSDALAPLGLPEGDYPWDGRTVTVAGGTARLSDGTLAGTTLPLLEGARNLVRWGACAPEVAIALATEAPRAAIREPGLAPGQPAALLRWFADGGGELNWQRFAPAP